MKKAVVRIVAVLALALGGSVSVLGQASAAPVHDPNGIGHKVPNPHHDPN